MNKESDVNSRRGFFKFAGIAGGAVAVASVSRVAMAALPEPVIQTGTDTMAPLVPNTGRPYNPVVTLNGWTLPWRMNNGVKEFHLVAEPVVREVIARLQGQHVGLQRPKPRPHHRGGGRRPRAHLRDQQVARAHHGPLARSAFAQRHGRCRRAEPAAFQSARPLSTSSKRAGQGTFMYHPHADEMVQMAMGMMGMWVTHPKAKHPHISEVDRDFCFLAQRV
jgi:hypothetical protein